RAGAGGVRACPTSETAGEGGGDPSAHPHHPGGRPPSTPHPGGGTAGKRRVGTFVACSRSRRERPHPLLSRLSLTRAGRGAEGAPPPPPTPAVLGGKAGPTRREL